jgi:hypothetical protein
MPIAHMQIMLDIAIPLIFMLLHTARCMPFVPSAQRSMICSSTLSSFPQLHHPFSVDEVHTEEVQQ